MICEKCKRMVGRNKLTQGVCIDQESCKEMQDKKIEIESYRHSTLRLLQNVRFRQPKQK